MEYLEELVGRETLERAAKQLRFSGVESIVIPLEISYGCYGQLVLTREDLAPIMPKVQ